MGAPPTVRQWSELEESSSGGRARERSVQAEPLDSSEQ